jgi:8-amino-7-oxononanoate synthase
MTGPRKAFGLSAADKARLLVQLSGRRPAPQRPMPAPAGGGRAEADDLADLPLYEQVQMVRSAGEILGIANPFFQVHDGLAGAETSIGGRPYVNFSSYNYLGINGDARVAAAAKDAVDRYGTSVSASRLVAGERGIHRELERRLADLHCAEDCIAFVSGHATNVTVIGHLLGQGDLILHDALIHNSVLQGAQLSGARRLMFPHNDAAAAGRLLAEHRGRHRRVLIVIEGHYSMDGDLADFPAFQELARSHGTWLLVDEAHSIGVLGAAGRGVAEHFGIADTGSTLWMGTLSKALAGCGGYVAGRRQLIEYLKFSAPGFVYSVGMSPPVTAASIAALDIMAAEPERVARLNANAGRFVRAAKDAGLDTGHSEGWAIVPVITGSSIAAARLSHALFERGINVQPIFYPAVPERAARLRFFLSADHTEDQVDRTVAALAEESARIKVGKIDLAALALRLGALATRPG